MFALSVFLSHIAYSLPLCVYLTAFWCSTSRLCLLYKLPHTLFFYNTQSVIRLWLSGPLSNFVRHLANKTWFGLPALSHSSRLLPLFTPSMGNIHEGHPRYKCGRKSMIQVWEQVHDVRPWDGTTSSNSSPQEISNRIHGKKTTKMSENFQRWENQDNLVLTSAWLFKYPYLTFK